MELSGYKTFANRTLFEFADFVTSIVGPNGSGKSNIADSIRWVLGEQSYRLLRGKKTEDMIFSGSDNRPRAGMAYATITFDNQDGWLPIDFSEVAITRRAYRDGQNEYLINGQRVRLMDVSELLAQSGLAERTYTIIGQGLVDAALSLRADERRRLFEEAAGIGLHRSRREDALRRLDTTRRNLERVQDILTEIKPRLRSLERQAKRASEFGHVKSDLMALLKEWYGYHWRKSQKELSRLHSISEERELKLKKLQAKQLEQDKKSQEIRQTIYVLREKISQKRNDLDLLRDEKNKLLRDIAVSEERKRALSERRLSTLDELKNLKGRINIQNELLLSSSKEIKLIKRKNEKIKLQFDEIKKIYDYEVSLRDEIEGELNESLKEKLNVQAQHESLLVLRNTYLNQLQSLNIELGEAKSDMREVEIQIDISKKKLEEIRKKINLEVSQTEDLVDQISELNKKIEVDKNDLQVVETELLKIDTNFVQVQNKKNILEQSQSALSGYPEGTRALIKAGQNNELKGLIGALRDLIEVPDDLELAISAALNIYMEAVVIDDDPEHALDLLNSKSAPGVVIPVGVEIRKLHVESSVDIKNEKIYGFASEIIRYPKNIKPIVDVLLSDVLVVQDRNTARKVLVDLNGLKSAVTLKGELFNSSGPVVSSGNMEKAQRIFSFDSNKELEKIQTQINKLNTSKQTQKSKKKEIAENIITSQELLSKLNLDNQNVNRKLSELREEEIKLKNQKDKLEWKIESGNNLIMRIEKELMVINSKIEEITDELVTADELSNSLKNQHNEHLKQLNAFDQTSSQSQYFESKTEYAISEQVVRDTEELFSEKKDYINELLSQKDILTSRIDELDKSTEMLDMEISEFGKKRDEINKIIDRIRIELDPIEEELNEQEAGSIRFSKIEDELRIKVRESEQRYTNARIDLASQHEVVEGLRNRIEDDFGLVVFDYSEQASGPKPLPFEGLVEELPVIEEISTETERSIKSLRNQLRRMGPINPEAEREYIEVKERNEFLENQIQDLYKAETDVRQVISELDNLMREEFCKTFEKVEVEFSDIFARLFGGGSAHLILSDPDDIANTGIEIDARLPGRRTQGLSLLSGGERSLTAVALIFALIRVSPTPFCLLDEVDAMLDEANTQRFRGLLKEMSQQTQFVIVTHNRNTVEAAEVIYGVTMGRDSASQVLSLNIDELSKVID